MAVVDFNRGSNPDASEGLNITMRNIRRFSFTALVIAIIGLTMFAPTIADSFLLYLKQ
ncbi:hypothetical protein GCM10008927_00760 [Amylibacter ulvae]|uniref:Uncharacterized protein n=1 Tax=Paramylibacter ulvae TaxID=1651968 RepID=A0ABQ3CRB1_9RHOB|nr:hypothetical protein [Amylibacter ulvae]GHA40456.1 hypothetical protein GCM10008927_00760 [Amylibacter ulvae]